VVLAVRIARTILRVNTNLTELRFGDQTVMVATVVPPGSESTSAADKIRERAVDALEQARSAIEAVAESTVETANSLRKAAMAPASVEVELGIAFTAKGGVVVAGGEVQASIVVHLTYELTDKNGSAHQD
jgi:Trypsin-co-occurring domain 1